ncbi:MAG: glycosyltransferase WbuB, partial [Burkholderiales bacterium]|nr:glycosyltransferase WbuB [Burkholderiales bacterium]
SYLAAGMPIIAALNGEGADIVKAANAGFTCAAGNAEALAEIALKMANLSLRERQVMGNSGRDYSALEFDRRKVLDMAEKYFYELLK